MTQVNNRLDRSGFIGISRRSRKNWLAYGGERPGNTVWLLLGYAALFIIRPWEFRPDLAFLPWERMYAIVLIVAVIMLLVTSRKKNTFGPVLTSWSLLLVFMGISWAFSVHPAYSWVTFEVVLKLAVFAACLVLVLKRRADLRLFVLGWAAILVIYQAKSLWEFLVHGRGVYRMGTWRLLGMDLALGDPNAFAATTVFGLPLLFWLLRIERRRTIRVFLLAALALSITVVIQTGSRGGFLIMALYLLSVVALSRKKLLAIIILALIGLTAIFYMPDDIVRRYETMIDPTIDESATESAQGRREGLNRGIAMARQRPLTGVGPGCTVLAHIAIHDLPHPNFQGMQAHTLIGQLVGELGFTGGAIWAAFYITFLTTNAILIHRSRRRRDTFLAGFGRAALEIAVLLFLFGFVGHNLYRYTWLWAAALTDVALRISKQPERARGPS